jgi:hypothetical protein
MTKEEKREKERARKVVYYATNRDKLKSYQAVYDEAHRDERLVRCAAYASTRREYFIWCGIKDRTTNPRNVNYEDYGLEFIRMRSRWKGPAEHGFKNFLTDMGPRPSPDHTIDRIDGDYGYTPENCRWATRREQALNRINTHWITFQGKTLCLTEWAKEIGIYAGSLSNRLKRGWPIEKALTTPPVKKQKNNPEM